MPSGNHRLPADRHAGVVTLTLNVNDATGSDDRTVGIKTLPADATFLAGMTGAYRAILAVLSSAARLEVESAATLTGTWTTNTSNLVSGSSRFTTTPGDYAEWANVAFPASGRVHLVAHSLGFAAFGTPASADVYVDGVKVKTVSSTTLSLRQQKTGASTSVSLAPCAIAVDAAPGTHTVRVVHTGSSGQFLSLDFIAVPAVSPPPIFAAHEYNNIVAAPAGGGYTQAQLDVMNANRAVLDPAYAAVAAEFSNVTVVQLALDQAGISTGDGLHPNEHGAIQIADEYAMAIRRTLANYAPDNLYTGAGAITTPQLSQNLTAVAAWPAASGGTVRFTTRQMVCISGGTVTVISIDNVATGLTSGVFHIKPGHGMQITYSVVPNVSSWDIT